MTAITLKQVNEKLKSLPDNLAQDVEKYIDFLLYNSKKEEEYFEVPNWHKDIVLDRIKNPIQEVDAFKMIEKLEN